MADRLLAVSCRRRLSARLFDVLHYGVSPRVWAVVALVAGQLARSSMGEAQTRVTGRHPMAMVDIIGMSTFGYQFGPWMPDADVPSPDGQLHAILLKQGDVVHNTNTFTLLLIRTEALFAAPRPDTLLRLASSSNRPAISHLKWLGDSRTLFFLGERLGAPQIYALDVRTRQLSQRTHATTEITSYNIIPSGDVLVYAAKPPVDTSGYAAMRQHGFAVRPGQFVGDLLTGAWADAASEWFGRTPPQLWVWRAGAPAPALVALPGPYYHSCDPDAVSVAPTGRVALIVCTREHVPALWKEYSDPHLARLLAGGDPFGEFALLDLNRGTIEPLVEAPVTRATFRWAPTGESVVLANAFLPLDVPDSIERSARAARPGIAEVTIRPHCLTVIAHRDSLDVVGWDEATKTVELVAGIFGLGARDGPRVSYRKIGSVWREVRSRAASEPRLVVEQGLNVPPRLVAVDAGTKRRSVVLDPNPQLADVHLGHVETVRWRTPSGAVRVGGLYYPPDFVRGRRYPLVIQTHGFDSTVFAPDGVYPTANAAQPMAAYEILVLQLGAGDDLGGIRDIMTSDEAPRAMEDLEAAIDHLDSLGLIDRAQVGLIGFSRTCYHVLYALTHSRYRIAAAAITDGVDFSYLQYLVLRDAQSGAGRTLDEYTPVNGGPPFGNNLEVWRERAPGFNLDRITTPLRLEAIGPGSLLLEWEPYAGLLLQHKPAELFFIPEGEHLLVKPWERLASSGGNADWFRFWLKGEQDADPAKVEQYARWRELRKLQHPQTAGDTTGMQHGSSK